MIIVSCATPIAMIIESDAMSYIPKKWQKWSVTYVET